MIMVDIFLWLVLLFVFVSPFLFLLFGSTNIFIASAFPLTTHLFMHLTLPAHHNHLTQHDAFSGCDHACQNMSCWPIRGSFCLVFAFPLACTSIRTHPNWCAPIYTHSWHFWPHLTKHDVRGNFPGHGLMILVCKTLNDPCLPCFCVPHAPCALTQPCAPIRTYFHPFTPVCTLLLHVFMYNLIQK